MNDDVINRIKGFLSILLFKVAPLLISLIALWNTIVLSKKIIEPNVGTKLEFTTNSIPNGYMEDKTLPEFIVYNAGPVKVVSLSVDHLILDININTFKMENSQMPGIEDIGNHFLFEKELNVFDRKKKLSERLYGNDNNVVKFCLFDTRYFRESDMKEYKRRDIFFIDKGDIYFSKNYIDSNINKYNKIMEVIGDIDKRKAFALEKSPRMIKSLQIR
jgi:hypothetical protein